MSRLFLFPLLLGLAGCSAIVERQTAQLSGDLETAILQYDDPATVADAIPAYLLLLEARLQSRPEDAGLYLTTARLTGTYATLFGGGEASARRLSARALAHARKGACLRATTLCDLQEIGFESFEQRVADLNRSELEAAYLLATAWVGWIDTHSDDYAALADLPRAQALLDRVVEIAPEHDDGAAWLYLAVLHSQRPPAAGGRPELARRHFERARRVSAGRNLLVDVMLADHYARLLFDRELFVSSLERVIESEVDAPEYRLANAVARERAEELLNETERIFD
ncbi:TRAP transporter TatT component family protein [Wenzhouxiangella sp. EGI_FJ10409]|uniref:TRAP transporter TatT component family protein n=1 Tax=Wenzhouxiangella sp. EGI_FJ10409 TaxID=3243767 RepID=UPI0035DD6F45